MTFGSDVFGGVPYGGKIQLWRSKEVLSLTSPIQILVSLDSGISTILNTESGLETTINTASNINTSMAISSLIELEEA